jgi:hypothetical protein
MNILRKRLNVMLTAHAGVLGDDARGMFATNTIYSDLNIPQLESLPDSQPHRLVDLALVAADGEGTSTITGALHQTHPNDAELCKRLRENIHCAAEHDIRACIWTSCRRRTAEFTFAANTHTSEDQSRPRTGGHGGRGKKHLAERSHRRR